MNTWKYGGWQDSGKNWHPFEKETMRVSNGLFGMLSGCGCWLVTAIGVIALNLWLGTMSVQYIVLEVLHQKIDTVPAALIGLVGGEVTIPVAIIVWLLRWGGVTF